MKVLNIRNLPDEVHARLRLRAAAAGRSMEAEARAILGAAVLPGDPQGAIRRLQEMARPFRAKPGEKSVVDQLIEERRREAAREEAEWRSSTPPRSSR
jgi:plasmid stability protein